MDRAAGAEPLNVRFGYFADLGQTSGRDRDVPTPDGVNSPVLGLIVRFKVKDDEAAN
jgi:hypothetical protein